MEHPVPQDQLDAGPPVLPALWKARRTILLAAVVAAIVGYVASSLQPVRYEATAELLLADPRNVGVFRETGTTFLDPSRYVRNQAEFARSTPVLARAAELSGGRFDVQEVSELVTIRPSVDLDLLTITASDSTAPGAAQLANAVAQAYQDVVTRQVQESAQASLDELDAQRAELEAQIAAVEQQLEADAGTNSALTAERDAAVAQLIQIQSRADQITVDTSLFGSGVELFEEADEPEAPAAPKPLRNAVLAAVLGAMAAGGLAWWRADETAVAETRHDAQAVLGAPLLGQVPDFDEIGMESSVPTVSAPTSPAAEAYHFLVGALQHALADTGGKSVLITSPRPTDGKTTTTLNLAVAAAQDGREVLLVDMDTRVRGLTRFSGLPAEPGMVDLADPEVGLGDVVALLRLSGQVAVPFLTSGRTGHDAAAFFRTPGFRRAVEKMTAPADLVLIDSPPILLASDTSAIAANVDGIVVVVARGTPLRALTEVRERLDFVGTPVLGYVFNKSSARSGAGYGYAYDYRYGYGYGERNGDGGDGTTGDGDRQRAPARRLRRGRTGAGRHEERAGGAPADRPRRAPVGSG